MSSSSPSSSSSCPHSAVVNRKKLTRLTLLIAMQVVSRATRVLRQVTASVTQLRRVEAKSYGYEAGGLRFVTVTLRFL